MGVVLIFLLAIFVYLLYTYLVGKPHPKFPPGPLRWPFWGGYSQLLLENYRFPYKAMHWMAKRYNTEVLGLYLGSCPTIVACSNASVREMLNKPEFQGRYQGYVPRMRDSDGVVRGQFFTDGHRWTEQRRFMLRNLRDFGFGTRNKKLERIIEEEVRDFVHIVQSDVKGVSHKGLVTVPAVFYSFFLNITLELLLGARLPPKVHSRLREFAGSALQFQQAVDPSTGIINMTPWVRHFIPEWSGFNDCVQSNTDIKKFIQELVNEHKSTFLSDALRDYCDVYLREMGDKQSSDAEHWFSEEQMVMTMWDLLFPSSMTVTATMTFTIEFLLHHPSVQTKVQQEIDEVIGKSRLPNLDDRKNLPYTEAVLREVMRSETLVPLALPHRSTEDTYFQGYFVPKDTLVLPNLYSAHMDDKVWDNPEEFLPERHLEDGKLKKKDLTTPFGLGKRVCAGETFARQNMFLLFSAMMQNFSFELPAGQPLPKFEDHLTGINLAPKVFSVYMIPR